MIGPYQSETFLRYRSIASTCQALAAACFKRPGTPRERMRSFDLVPTQTAPNTDDRDCRVKPQTPGPQALANSSPPDADGVSLHPWLSLSGQYIAIWCPMWEERYPTRQLGQFCPGLYIKRQQPHWKVPQHI